MEKIEKCTCGCQERELNIWEKFIEKVKCVYYRLIMCTYRHGEDKKLIKNFEKELDRQSKYYGNSFINDCRPELIKIFKKAINQGWSGSVAPYFIHSLAKTIEDGLHFRALSPLTLDKDEWGDVHIGSDGRAYCQNKRNSAVFKDEKDNRPYYLDAFSKYSDAIFDIHTNTWSFRNPNESKICWSGAVYVIKKEALSKKPSKLTIDDVIFTSFGYIKDLEKFSNQSYQIPTIEIFDSSDTHNDFICDYCLETDFPEDFFNIYEFRTRDADPEDFKVIKKVYTDQNINKEIVL
jgi:hypothetical protein